MPAKISPADYFAQLVAGQKNLRESRSWSSRGTYPGCANLIPRSRKIERQKTESKSGLTFVSHRHRAIEPNHDDVRVPIPDGSSTTNRGRATHDGHPNRRRARAIPGTPGPIPDDDGKPSLDGCRATNARRAIHDARPNRPNVLHEQPPE